MLNNDNYCQKKLLSGRKSAVQQKINIALKAVLNLRGENYSFQKGIVCIACFETKMYRVELKDE